MLCGAPRCRGHYLIADPRRNLHGVGGPRWRLETMNLLHKSQFSRVHRPIKLNLTDHRRGAICLRRIDAEEKWRPTFRYNCRFRQTADAIHCISYMSLSLLRIFFPESSPNLLRLCPAKTSFEKNSEKEAPRNIVTESLSLSLSPLTCYVIDPISRISPAIRVTWLIS